LCQRYYGKSYDINVVPGTVSSAGVTWAYFTQSATVGDFGVTAHFKATMRAVPTVVFYSPDTGSSGVCGSQGGDKTATAQYAGTASVACYIYANNNNAQIRMHWTANSEL
jgi:hypothetical protein